MNDNSPTYTRKELMDALGIASASAFHHLRKKYPLAFVVVKQGNGRSNPTLYDKKAVSKFIQWRKIRALMDKYKDTEIIEHFPIRDLSKKPELFFIDDYYHRCGECGKELQLVRPGKYQCVNPECGAGKQS